MIPSEIGHLINLQHINLRDNQLTALPSEIGQLDNLEILSLGKNQLTALPPEIGRLKNLNHLDLSENPLPIPPEILAKTKEPQTIITWYLQNVLSGTPTRPLNEAKLILVGQGAVGKTSIVKRMLDGVFDPKEDMTKGIEIRRWQIQADSRRIKLNIWDFGGQEIMHPTHQFFMTKRTLYLLVLDSRLDEQANRLEYWLKIIQAFGGNAPILVLCNKCDQRLLELDWAGLQEKYPQIMGYVKRLSCKKPECIEELQGLIGQEVAQLERVSEPLAESWFAVKDRLAEMSGQKIDYLDYHKYEELCRELHIEDADSQRTLMIYLHELGIALHYAAQDPNRYFPLQSNFVLNPMWVTQGVYQILNSNLLFQNRGVLRIQDLGNILPADRYPPAKHAFIIDMMRYFELLFDFPEKPLEQFLVPDLLAKGGPDTGRWENSLAFQYHYDVLPGSIISRFIVRMHTHISEHTYWRTGVVLRTKDGNNRALIKADLEDKKITIFIDGEQPNRRRFLTSIRLCFEAIHDTIPGLKIEEKVPAAGASQYFIDYRTLLKMEQKGKKTDYVEEIDEGRRY